MATPRLTVVIPTLDEAASLPELLADLQAQQGLALRIVIADGGSRDGTPALARAAGATLVTAPRGRGLQMNAGAAADPDPDGYLLFLHADSRLTSPTLLADAVAALATAAARDPRPQAGHFRLRFLRRSDADAGLYDWMESKTALSRPGTINGDQGLLLSRRDHARLGPFDTRLPYLEDQDYAARVFAHGTWHCLPGELGTSARRFEREGAVARYRLMALMMGAWSAGLWAFFDEAPQVYAAQGATERLRLRPYVDLVHRLLRRQGLRGAAGTLWRASSFIAAQRWQYFHYRDWARRPRPAVWLARYDRWPLSLPPGLASALTLPLLLAWLYIWLPLRER